MHLNDREYWRAKATLCQILEMLYDKAPLDKIKLETLLDDMCYILKEDIIPGDLQIERSKNPFPAIDPIYYNKIFEDIAL